MLSVVEHPLMAEVQYIREIIKGVDGEIVEEWKWNAPSFSYKGSYLVTFNLREKGRVHLVFHNPRIVSTESSLLEGNYADRRMAYLADMEDVAAKRGELERVVRVLMELSAPE